MALAAQAATQPASEPQTIETHHEDMIHDSKLDFYGRRLATCSSDRTVKIFDVVNGAATGPGVTLEGHEGPVWQVAWAHPKFGTILASASYDGKVLIWKYEEPRGRSPGGWQIIKEHTMHSASVNSLAWGPPELGAVLACASSDGNVSVLTFNDDGTWAVDLVTAHPIGCNAVAWASSAAPGSLTSPQSIPSEPVRRLASAGCDNAVKIWSFSTEQNMWVEEVALAGHTDWVRDVAFAPNQGLPRTQLASAGQDRTVRIWTEEGGQWSQVLLDPGEGAFPDTVWSVSWSLSGNVLAVSCGDGKISLWKENLKGTWECVNEMDA